MGVLPHFFKSQVPEGDLREHGLKGRGMRDEE